MSDFENFLKARNKSLMPHQQLAAEEFLANPVLRRFLFTGMGSGKTWLFTELERFVEHDSLIP